MDIDKQRSALDYLWYELWMLKETSDKLKLLQKKKRKEIILENITLESFLVHARNLIYFLKDKNDGRDIKCSDFGIKKQEVNLPRGNSLVEIDKFLSHLTWDRVKKVKPNWCFDAIREEIENKKNIYINQLPDNLFPTPKLEKTKNDFLEA